MIPSTRICIAPNCQAQSRLIQSIKELDFHKGHSSSSLGQLTKKLKDVIPEFPITNSTKQLIESKFVYIQEYLAKKQEFFLKKCEKFDLIEAALKFINQEYSLLNEKAIDIVVKALPNNIQEILELQTTQYCELQIQIQKELDNLFQLICNIDKKPENVTVVQPKQKLSQIQATAVPITVTEKACFVKMPDSYEQLTKFEISNYRAKHLEGYPSFIMTNQIMKEGSSIRFEIVRIQSDYVGVGIGVMERKSIEKNGLILTGEQLQTIGHGVYMNFNDRCVYHSEIDNGAVNGKDQGISFQNGDKILCSYNQGQLSFINQTTNSTYTMKVTISDIIFIAWLDLSEIKII